MSWIVLDDEAVLAAITPEIAVAVARNALVSAHNGKLAAPPREVIAAGLGDLVFTVGGTPDVAGFRCYQTWSRVGDQVVAVWDDRGSLRGITVGDAIGVLRTGALGAVAADVLARRDASAVAFVGAGAQAWAQLWALTAVRDLADVRVASRSAARRDAFVARARRELGVPARPAADVAEALRGAGIVIVATRATRPLFATTELSSGAHVTSVGPKSGGASEIPTDLVEAAAIVASDSPAQLAADPESITRGADVRHVGALAARPWRDGQSGDRSPGGLTLYCSAGLAGSEVLLAAAAIRAAGGEETRQ